MTKTLFASGAFVCALAVSALPGFAQNAPGKPPMPPSIGPSLHVDFGAGRQVRVNCGEITLVDCVAAVTPVIDKVAAAEPVHGPGPGGHGGPGGPGGPKDGKGHKDKGPKDKGPGGPGGPEGEAPPAP